MAEAAFRPCTKPEIEPSNPLPNFLICFWCCGDKLSPTNYERQPQLQILFRALEYQ